MIDPRSFSIVVGFRNILTEDWQIFLRRFDLLPTELPPHLSSLLQSCFDFLSFYLIFLEDEYLQSSVYHKCKDNMVRDSVSNSELYCVSPCNLSNVGLTLKVFHLVSPSLSCPRYCRIICSAWKPSLLASSSALCGWVFRRSPRGSSLNLISLLLKILTVHILSCWTFLLSVFHFLCPSHALSVKKSAFPSNYKAIQLVTLYFMQILFQVPDFLFCFS